MTCKRYLSDDRRRLLCDIALIPEIREKIAEAKGKLVGGPEDLPQTPIISVGDRVTISLIEWGRHPQVAVVDLREKRGVNCSVAYLLSGYIVLASENPPGTITTSSWDRIDLAIRLALSGLRISVIVKGEEDLLGFPAVILAPEGWTMVYGQPGQGMMAVKITDVIKKQAENLLLEAFHPI